MVKYTSNLNGQSNKKRRQNTDKNGLKCRISLQPQHMTQKCFIPSMSLRFIVSRFERQKLPYLEMYLSQIKNKTEE